MWIKCCRNCRQRPLGWARYARAKAERQRHGGATPSKANEQSAPPDRIHFSLQAHVRANRYSPFEKFIPWIKPHRCNASDASLFSCSHTLHFADNSRLQSITIY